PRTVIPNQPRKSSKAFVITGISSGSLAGSSSKKLCETPMQNSTRSACDSFSRYSPICALLDHDGAGAVELDTPAALPLAVEQELQRADEVAVPDQGARETLLAGVRVAQRDERL